MTEQYIKKIAAELSLSPRSVGAAVELLDEGSTVPFIARYRKEATGELDEKEITDIRDRIHQLREVDKRREAILKSLKDQKKLTDELKEQVMAAETLSVLEDIYLPYRPKRRTRATKAKEKGLEPLAETIFVQDDIDLQLEAAKYVDEEKGVKDVKEALAGARDIIAEWINEDAETRAEMRELFFTKGVFRSRVIKGKETEGTNYRDYFDWEEPVTGIPSHRLLAVRRGEKESFLMLRVIAPEEEALRILEQRFVRADNAAAEQVKEAMTDAYKRLLSLSMETEVRMASKQQADKDAIAVFAKNLRQLLMAPPLGHHRVMAIDPGFRTGCKVVCLDENGKLLINDTIYPTGSAMQEQQAARVVKDLCERFRVRFIAIGNGTASRETEEFIRGIGLPKDIHVMLVNESGASIYSASDAAREEFPDHDVTVRGSISIGRRLMDPLAELVKIDPKSIGVGQYQHDVDQNLLRQSLDDVVISCVNQVGVELNTASKQLLTYVSGLGPTRAQAVVRYREEGGRFNTREDLFNVSGLGPKAIEQSAGFLRIRDGANPLDASAVHPESYPVVEAMARDLKCSVSQLMRQDNLRQRVDLDQYVTETTGLPTLEDIIAELAKPGRDPRDKFEIFRFKEDVTRPEDLTPGMKLPGIVTNVTNFGAFVDVGVHLDGLVHISQLSDKYIKDPNDVVQVHQKVDVTVLEVDLPRGRIALSMKRDLRDWFGTKKS
ncbi:MAG: Tex family protein [Candidatus Omnitrophota bacterium]